MLTLNKKSTRYSFNKQKKGLFGGKGEFPPRTCSHGQPCCQSPAKKGRFFSGRNLESCDNRGALPVELCHPCSSESSPYRPSPLQSWARVCIFFTQANFFCCIILQSIGLTCSLNRCFVHDFVTLCTGCFKKLWVQ